MVCGALPQPRSRRAWAHAPRAAGGALVSRMILTSVVIASSVCNRAKDRISIGALAIYFSNSQNVMLSSPVIRFQAKVQVRQVRSGKLSSHKLP